MSDQVEGNLPPANSEPPAPPEPAAEAVVESGVQENPIPQHVQSLIDAYRQYSTFTDHFQSLEKATEATDPSKLELPWNKIGEEVNKDKRSAARVIDLAGKDTTPEQLGQALYEAKDKFNALKLVGTVKAFQRGGCIIMAVDNEADLRKAGNIAYDEDEHHGHFQRSTFRLKNEKGLTAVNAGIPTIVVLDDGQLDVETTIQHELNHYRFSLYSDLSADEAAYSTPKATSRGLAFMKARELIDKFQSGETDEAQLLESLHMYAQENKLRAFEEMSCQMMATQKIDIRRPYVDDYFRDITQSARDSPIATTHIDQVKAEFEKDMKSIQRRVARSVAHFQSMESDPEVVFGTVGMSLFTAKAETVEEVLESFDYIVDITSKQDLFNFKQELEFLQDDNNVRLANIAGKKELYIQIGHLRDRFSEAAKSSEATQAYGYKRVRQEGGVFPSALKEAALKKEGFARVMSGMKIEKDQILDEAKQARKLLEAREAIAQETPKPEERVENKQPLSKIVEPAPMHKALKRLTKLIGR